MDVGQQVPAGSPPIPAEPLPFPVHELDYTPSKPRHDAPPRQPESTTERANQFQRAKQRGLGFDGEVLKQTIIKKLLQVDRPALAEPLIRCHTEATVKLCTGCYAPKVFYNRCENFYCPSCAKRLANDRRKSVEWWGQHVTQPKHLVLTARNSQTFTAHTVRAFKEAWAKLRRRAFAKNWRGGFYSLEVTNEGKGWHLHLHALIDAHWIDSGRLAREWADCIGQDFAIVKVKDCRAGDYLRELCKYIVDGNQLAAWTPEQIRDYIEAFKGQRSFGVFGALYKLRQEHRKFLDEVQADKLTCECGCTSFRFFTEAEWEWFECVNGKPSKVSSMRSAPTAPAVLREHQAELI
jgi:hypothetical protein